MANKRIPKDETETPGLFAALFTDDDETFTDKEKMFCLSYCTDARFNQSKAAKLAGYDGKDDLSFRVIGSELMSKRKIKNKINQILETFVAPKMQVLMQLTQQANSSVLDVMDDEFRLDLKLAKERGTDHLIQEITIEENVIETKTDENDEMDDLFDDPRPAGRRGKPKPKPKQTIETNVVQRKTKFKMYSAQRAMELVGKHFGLFADNVRISNPDGTPIGGGKSDVFLLLPDNGRGDAPYLKLQPGEKPSAPKKTRKVSNAPGKTRQNALKRETKNTKNTKKAK